MWPKKVAPINNFLKVIQYVGGKKKSNAFIVSGSVSFLKWYWVNMGQHIVEDSVNSVLFGWDIWDYACIAHFRLCEIINVSYI